MESRNIIVDGPDLIIRLTWSERLELADRIEAIQQRMESNFERIF